jgi:membrane fusion protein, heavy metal efflux system
MITPRQTPAPFLVLGILVALGCSGSAGPETGPALERGGGDAVTIWTDELELFFEYPPLVAGAPGEAWAIHLTTLADFQPVTEGTLTLRLQGTEGAVVAEMAQEPARPGIYTNAPSFNTPGRYDLVIEYRGQGLEEDFAAGSVQVFGSEEEVPLAPEEAHAGISFLKEQQWPIDFATVPAALKEVRPGLRATGEVLGATDGMAEITAPVEGIIRWEENRYAPAEGAWVARGEALVRLSPVGGDNAYASLVGRSELLEREVARMERLVAAEAVPARRLEEARLELDVVRAQLNALGAPPAEGYTLVLRSPIAGSITARHFSVGQRVSAGAPLFSVLDPRTVRIRFNVPAVHAADLAEVTAATFSPEGTDEVFQAGSLRTVGAALDPGRRTVAVTFHADNPGGILKPGMLVHGRILLSDGEPALAVPAPAVTDENGILVAYVQTGGETFERRPVTIGETDGQWTTILSGVRPGERVATRGTYQIRLASLNTSQLSDHGHVH